jgi:ABC-2 type transport system permease protein
MLWSLISFEFKYWKNRPNVYALTFLIFLFSLLAFTLEDVSIRGSSDIIYRNSPYIIFMLYLFWLLFLPVFINNLISFSISRDFEYKFHEMIYSYPVKLNRLYTGRFIGSVMVSVFLFTGVLLADIISPLIPWAPENQLQSFSIYNHLYVFFLLVVPDVFIMGSLLFLVISKLKNIQYSILVGVFFIVLYLALMKFAGDIDNKWIPSLIDPLGLISITIEYAKYSPFEKNHLCFPITDKFIVNRIIWLSVSIVCIIATVLRIQRKRFSSSSPDSSSKKVTEKIPVIEKPSYYKEEVFNLGSYIRMLHGEAKMGMLFLLKSRVFIVVVAMVLLILLLRWFGTVSMDEIPPVATSFNTIQQINSYVNFILRISVIFLVSELFWYQKQFRFNEIRFSLPAPDWLFLASQVLSMLYFIVFIQTLLSFIGILYQLINGVFPIEIDLYFKQLLMEGTLTFILLSVFCIIMNVWINNKYLAMGITALILFTQDMILSAFRVESHMVGILYNKPEVIYSDFYGYGPYAKPLIAFLVYWTLVYALFFLLTVYSYSGFEEMPFLHRMKKMFSRFLKYKQLSFFVLFITLGYSAFLYYQTQIKNTYTSHKEMMEQKGYYEKTFKKWENYPVPKVVHADYIIDLYGKQREYEVKGKLIMVNKDDTIIDRIFLNNSKKFPYRIKSDNLIAEWKDDKSNYSFECYKLKQPLKKGDTLIMEYEYHVSYKGIENDISDIRLLPDGTFLDNSSFTPQFGYSDDNEIKDKSERKKHNLPLKDEHFPPLQRNCTSLCMKDYLGLNADWTTVHSIISTYTDQIAIAPGTLVKQWKDSDRNYFEYELRQPSKFLFSIVSGTYKVKKEKHKHISCEVYYHPKHEFNVAEMMKALKRSIDFYDQNYGPYRHAEARIIEFPHFSSFAQAFPGTMPYSESIGFTSNLSDNPEDINRIFHVVTHEMAHQWWAHQVIGAKMQGAPLLSESLAEFSSVLLLEKEYGKDMLGRFLKDECKQYITGRSYESQREPSLITSDKQDYVYYNKASVMLYSLYQLLGKEKIFSVLQSMINDFAYKEPPYPTAWNLLDKIYAVTPDSLKNKIKENMEEIVIYDADIAFAKVEKQNDSLFTISCKINFIKEKFNPQAKVKEKIEETEIGKGTKVHLNNDYIPIAVYTKSSSDSKTLYGEEIFFKTYKLNSNSFSFQIQTHKKPDKIVIDPFYLNIWKNSDNKVKKL